MPSPLASPLGGSSSQPPPSYASFAMGIASQAAGAKSEPGVGKAATPDVVIGAEPLLKISQKDTSATCGQTPKQELSSALKEEVEPEQQVTAVTPVQKRQVISQEETDQAVTALLGESFEKSFDSSAAADLPGSGPQDCAKSTHSSIMDQVGLGLYTTLQIESFSFSVLHHGM